MIKVDENDPVGELQPSFPYRDVTVKRNVDVKDYYELESEIGRGKFGTVYRCKEKSTLLTLAAKFVGIARRQDRRNVEREVEIMRTLQHPRLIQLYDAFECNSVMCVIQELIEGGELFERVIDDDFILTEKACTVFMRQICEGVEFIHSQNILHLDLKPENILCLTRTGNRIKIIDFGLARKFEPDKKLQVLFGTPEFVAPEVVNFEQIGFGTDMWSVGVICYVLLSGLSPFMGETDVETMANVTIAQYDFDDEAFDDISDDAKDFIAKLLTKNIEQRLTASECLSHLWLRRKPPPPLPPQLTPPKQEIEIIPQPMTNEILDNTKENLREFVDRWTEQGGASPSKIITMPINEPFKEINDHNVKSPQIISDINKNLIKPDMFIPENSVSRMEIDDNNISSSTNPQNINERSVNNPNRFDRKATDATQINSENEIPGKKLKLDTEINNVNLSSDNNSSIVNLQSGVNTNLVPENKDLSLTVSPLETLPSNNLQSDNINNVSPILKSPSGNKVNVKNENKNLNHIQSPTKLQSSPRFPISSENNIGLETKSPSSNKINSDIENNASNSSQPTKLQPSSSGSRINSVAKSPSDNKINSNVENNTSNYSQPTKLQPSPSGSRINSEAKSPSDNKINSDIENNTANPSQSSAKLQPSSSYSKINSVSKPPSDNKISLNIVNKNFNSIPSPTKSQPSSPVGTIPKTPSGSKLKFNVDNDTGDKNKQQPLEINTASATVQKIPSSDKINTNSGQKSETKETSYKLPTNSSPSSSRVSPQVLSPTIDQNKSVSTNKSNEPIHPPPHVTNVIGSRSNDTIHKPPQTSNLGVPHKPKLLSQFSVPSDLAKCSLNKNIPASDNFAKQKEIYLNKSAKDNNIMRTDSRSNINNIDKQLPPSDGRFNKSLNKHVIPPKIHGIVLGQNDSQESNETSELLDKKSPKVITHKIFVEGRSEPILPATLPSLVNKENKKNDSRSQKPISKSLTSSKLELKENSNVLKNKTPGNRFIDNDRFDRRGSDFSCFLHNSENLERTNLADEIKKLSSRLFQMGKSSPDEQPSNNVMSNPIPISSFRNDPIGRFLANHGVVTRRPKYRMSYLNRDVPLGSPPPASNLFYHLSHSNSDTWSDNQTHSAPQSPSASPEREVGTLTKEVILRLFDKNNGNNNQSPAKEEANNTAMSSIDSLASYFKTNNENNNNNSVPPVVSSK